MTNQYLVTNAFEFEDGRPSMVSDDGSSSFTVNLVDLESVETDVHLWVAPPGRYEHPGSPAGETFVVLSGHATLRIDGHEHVIGPGSVARIPPDTPSAMVVDELLKKVALLLH